MNIFFCVGMSMGMGMDMGRDSSSVESRGLERGLIEYNYRESKSKIFEARVET